MLQGVAGNLSKNVGHVCNVLVFLSDSARCNRAPLVLQRAAAACLLLTLSCLSVGLDVAAAEPPRTYRQLRHQFESPDHARWGEVPLWWWEGDRMTRQRVTWQLETLAAAGVKSVCPIQRSPARCDPPSFSPEWWEMLAFAHEECRRLGMTLWAYDQVGYGHYGWLEKAAAKAGDDRTSRVEFLTVEGSSGKAVRLELPKGTVLGARAYKIEEGVADDATSIDVKKSIAGEVFEWTPPEGDWRVGISVVVPDQVFQLSDRAADTFIDMFYGQIERSLGADAMGRSFVGIFQDEHPPTPRDVFTQELADEFQKRYGYDLARAIPALHFDVGPLTPKYRTDFFDAYLALDEESYWKRIYDWTAERGLLTSHDNWGRNNIYQQSQGYIDYFRTQRWFSAPGFDDAGTGSVDRRNYYDTKIAASIARLYGRPRVWSEAFHSSGWGRTTDQTLSWLSANYVFGANLYDEHGLYYSARASTWEHAAPDPHWRQPYWCYYGVLSDWVARASHLMSQGTHVVDVGVHYPVVSLLAGEPPETKGPDYNYYMQISRAIFDAGIDNDIIDDDSILSGRIENGSLRVRENAYRALVFGPETTVRRPVLEKALALVESGGIVVFAGSLPTATTEGGRSDPRLAPLLAKLLPADLPTQATTAGVRTKEHPSGGVAALVPSDADKIPRLLSARMDRDFLNRGGKIFVTHRRIGEVDLYMVQNAKETPAILDADFRVDGVPELWDPFTGKVGPVDRFERKANVTTVRQQLDGNMARVIVFRPGDRRRGVCTRGLTQPEGLAKPLSDDWEFSVIPTRDNRWGEFRWPPSDELIGPEIRSFRYAEEASRPGTELGWHKPDFGHADWETQSYSTGPFWLSAAVEPADTRAVEAVLGSLDSVLDGAGVPSTAKPANWQPVRFSKTIGLARPTPWGGHSGYPDGSIDQNFIELPPGRKLLFTRLRSPKPQRLGLRVELRNSAARLWVGGVEQPFEDAVGNLPLEKGENTVLLDLPDGGHGMLYVQADPPSVTSMEDAGDGMVKPDLKAASWIQGRDLAAGYLRRSFQLKDVPTEARILVSGYTGYNLFVNGTKVEEQIGPWADWTHPESLNVTSLLRKGENVIAAWVQVHAGQNVHGEAENKGLVLAMSARLSNGDKLEIVSDGSWKAAAAGESGWQDTGFDASAWQPAHVAGAMGTGPWGTEVLENVGVVTEPRRELAIDLPSPYLTCFDSVPDLIYDVKPSAAGRVGWYRFTAPPGVRKLTLNTSAAAQVWVDGTPAKVANGVAEVSNPPTGKSTVAIRLQMRPGEYGGDAFKKPIGLELKGGTIQPGLWADFGLPTYSGIGVYRQEVDLSAAEAGRRTVLDLGQVLVAAEVLVNGKSAGVRLARPFAFDIGDLVREGTNTIEVRVANTVAPHYTVTNKVANLGPTDSGLIGPVTLKQELPLAEWKRWAASEIGRLRKQLKTPTPEIEAAQREWEKSARWTVLWPIGLSPTQSSQSFPGDFDCAHLNAGPEHSMPFHTDLMDITGFRLEQLAGVDAGAELQHALRITATPQDKRQFVGRYVRVEIPDRREYLHMAEVEVYSGAKNVAHAGRATQSSTSLEAVAGRAIDDNTNGSWGGNSVSHTSSQLNPWWEVDLGASHPINRIVIFNRTDGDLESRLHGFRVTVLDENREPVWKRLVAEPPDPKAELYLSPVPVEFASVTIAPVSRDANSSERPPGSRVLILRTKEKLGFSDGTTLEIKLRSKPHPPGGPARRIRISATTMSGPLHDIPPGIARILATSIEKRTNDEAARLAAFFRSIAPQLQPVRDCHGKLTDQLDSLR